MLTNVMVLQQFNDLNSYRKWNIRQDNYNIFYIDQSSLAHIVNKCYLQKIIEIKYLYVYVCINVV